MATSAAGWARTGASATGSTFRRGASPGAEGREGRPAFRQRLLRPAPSGNALLEAEFEYHKVSQRSVPGFGLLDKDGDGVPRPSRRDRPADQPELPAVVAAFESRATTGSIRFQQALSANWQYGLRYGTQRIRTDDRLAFPDGCSAGPVYLYPASAATTTSTCTTSAARTSAARPIPRTPSCVATSPPDGAARTLGGVTRTRYKERYDPMQPTTGSASATCSSPWCCRRTARRAT